MAAGIAWVRSKEHRSASAPSSLASADRRDCWTASMFEVAAALCAGLGVTAAVLAATAPPSDADETGRPAWGHRLVRRWFAEEVALAEGAGLSAGAAGTVMVLQVAAAVAGGSIAAVLTGLPVLFAAGAGGAVASVRGGLAARTRAIRVARQDAVIESVRMLRQLLETGATTVPAAMQSSVSAAPLRFVRSFESSRLHLWDGDRRGAPRGSGSVSPCSICSLPRSSSRARAGESSHLSLPTSRLR